jgi:hypothetical protein
MSCLPPAPWPPAPWPPAPWPLAPCHHVQPVHLPPAITSSLSTCLLAHHAHLPSRLTRPNALRLTLITARSGRLLRGDAAGESLTAEKPHRCSLKPVRSPWPVTVWLPGTMRPAPGGLQPARCEGVPVPTGTPSLCSGCRRRCFSPTVVSAAPQAPPAPPCHAPAPPNAASARGRPRFSRTAPRCEQPAPPRPQVP